MGSELLDASSTGCGLRTATWEGGGLLHPSVCSTSPPHAQGVAKSPLSAPDPEGITAHSRSVEDLRDDTTGFLF